VGLRRLERLEQLEQIGSLRYRPIGRDRRGLLLGRDSVNNPGRTMRIVLFAISDWPPQGELFPVLCDAASGLAPNLMGHVDDKSQFGKLGFDCDVVAQNRTGKTALRTER
jgi:hypothetical protein